MTTMKCPGCKRRVEFHDDEAEGVKEGGVFCLECTAKRAHDAFVMEIIAGEHDHLVPELNEEEEDA